MNSVLDIYTDGSHLDKQHGGRLGCGGILVDKNGPGFGTKIDEYSEELTLDRLEHEFGYSAVSNPTAELIGVLQALREFYIPPQTNVIIHADYNGVKFWMEGSWKVKEPYLKKVKEAIEHEINSKGLRGRVSYEWVKGHQKPTLSADAYWNNQVDHLAKGR